MGCFNIAGFFTNQMIVRGNPVVAFLCCSFDVPVKLGDKVFDKKHYSIPLSMPIFGDYNDYGGIENIVESPVTRKLEEFFGYNIDSIVSDVLEFSIDEWMEPWDTDGRYGQIKKGREKDPNYDFMNEEFDRYAPKYEQIRDLVTRYNSLDRKESNGDDCLGIYLAKAHAKEVGISEEEAIAKVRESSWEDIEKTNFNIFWAIDHAALWKAFSVEYDAEDEDEESTESMMGFIKEYFTERTDRYDTTSCDIPGLDNYVLCICNEPSMLKEFAKFVLTVSNNLEFHFRRPHNYNQSWDIEEYNTLNKMILDDTQEDID